MSHYHKLGNSHHVILLYSHKSNNASEFIDVFRARPITSYHVPSQKKDVLIENCSLRYYCRRVNSQKHGQTTQSWPFAS